MAEPVIAAPAPQAAPTPAAPVLASNEVMQEFAVDPGDGYVEPDAPAQGDDIEEPAVPVEKPKAVVSLPEFCHEDGTPNWELIKQTRDAAANAGATAQQIQQAYNSDPEYRLNYIKWLVRKGSPLLPVQQAELDAAKTVAAPPQAVAPAKPKLSRAQVKANIDKALAEGTATQAQCTEYWYDQVTRPENEAMLDQRFAADKAARDAQAAQERAYAAQSQANARYVSELKEAHEAYKELVVPDASMQEGYRITDPRVLKEMVAIGGTKPILWKLKTALRELGMDATQKAKAKTATGMRPGTAAPAPRAVQPTRRLNPNEIVQTASVAGFENE